MTSIDKQLLLLKEILSLKEPVDGNCGECSPCISVSEKISAIYHALEAVQGSVAEEIISQIETLPFHAERDDYDGSNTIRQVTYTTDMVHLENQIREKYKLSPTKKGTQMTKLTINNHVHVYEDGNNPCCVHCGLLKTTIENQTSQQQQTVANDKQWHTVSFLTDNEKDVLKALERGGFKGWIDHYLALEAKERPGDKI